MNDSLATTELISPQSLILVQSVAEHGSMAAAARSLGIVPSAMTYRIRQIEEALDVLLFDRSARHARITPAGQALLDEGARVLNELDAVARRVKRVATGWEPTLTIAMDGLISMRVILELVERFLKDAPPTRLRLQNETLSGTLQALHEGRADLVLGAPADAATRADVDVQMKPLGEVQFVFAVAPHHPLARIQEPISNREIQAHRIVAVADSVRGPRGVTVGILPGQDVLTVSTLADKMNAQIRGLGCGYLPASMIQSHIDEGRLVVKKTEHTARTPKLAYAWRKPARGALGKALAWWLDALAREKTQSALLSQF